MPACWLWEVPPDRGDVFDRSRRRNPASILGYDFFYVGRGWPYGWWEAKAPGTAQPNETEAELPTAPVPPAQDNTRRVYRAAWAKSSASGALTEASARFRRTHSWSWTLVHLRYSGRSPSTARVAIAAIKYVHRRAGHPVAWAGDQRLARALRDLEQASW